jgi:ABC-type transport system involved in multi-copper enzyme maturation permease subunit
MTFGYIAFSVELGLVTARLFGIERKHKTLGGLYTLPLGTGPLIWQKVLGALPTFIPSAGMYFVGIAITGNAPGRNFWGPWDAATVMLFASEYLFFACLVMYFSLRMRRAVLATSIATLFLANVLVRMLESGSSYSTRNAITAILLGVLIVIVAVLIPRRLDQTAAEE